MRKCLRCENEMVENLEVMVSNGGYGIDVREKGMFKNAIGKIKCAVCPECGYYRGKLAIEKAVVA